MICNIHRWGVNSRQVLFALNLCIANKSQSRIEGTMINIEAALANTNLFQANLYVVEGGG